MDIYAMRREINEARQVLENADRVVNSIAPLMQGRLHHVDSWVLVELKKELRDFNAHTKEWKGD